MELVVNYVYDAWGNHEGSTYAVNGYEEIAKLNPFRYRGYYYDTETGLFWVQSRYYDPKVGRWVNADDVAYLDPESINGLNLYAYCLNNPVMYLDSAGTSPVWWQWLLFGIGAALVVAAAVVLTVVSCGAVAAPAGILGAVVLGAAKGALIGAAIGSAVGIAGGAVYAGVTGVDMGESILSGFLIGFGGGAILGAAIGGAVGAATYSPGIQWTSSRLHAGQRMLERSVNKNMVNTVLRTGKYVQQTADKFLVTGKLFMSGKITAVITTAGEFITVWNNTGKLKPFFDVIKKFFGG